jgi:hypothetical protein
MRTQGRGTSNQKQMKHAILHKKRQQNSRFSRPLLLALNRIHQGISHRDREQALAQKMQHI